jgi:hypothetical protein
MEVASFTPEPLYPRGKSPGYPLDTRPVLTLWYREKSLAPAMNRTPVVQHVVIGTQLFKELAPYLVRD